MSSRSSAPEARQGKAPHSVAPVVLFLLQIALVLTLHGGFRSELLDLTALAPGSYREPSLVTGMLESTRLMIPLLLGALAGLLLRRELAWKTLDPSQATRWLVTAVALVLAVTVATLDYNAWYGRVWPFDRLALVALAGLLAVHPGFTFPLLALLLVFLGQIAEPLPDADWHWPDKRLPIDFLILFVAFLCTRILTRAGLAVLIAAALILVGGAYSHAAVSKLEIGPRLWSWPLENSTSNIMVSAYLNGGWLRPLGDQRVVSFAGFLARLDPIVGVLTVLAELGGFLILVSPRLTRLLFAAWVSLHAVILLTTGIFFWKWILFDIGCALWLTRLARAPETQPAVAGAFARTTAIFGVLAMAITPRLYRNVDFAWFDTRLAGWFELTGVGASGQSYRIDPRYFAPYDITFQQSRFHYLRDGTALVGTYGVAHSHAIFSSLEGATARDVAAIDARLGRRLGNPRAADRWTEFVRAWFRASAARGARHVVPRWLSPPFHFQSFAAPNTYGGQEPLRELRVEYLEVFHEPDRLVPLRRDPVTTIDLR
jgi:hypothetical protein